MNWKYKRCLAIAMVAALPLGLAACGGGSSSPPALSMLDVTAPVMSGTYSTSAAPAALVSAVAGHDGPTSADTGESLTIGSYTLTCTAGPCSVTVSGDGERFTVAGTISVFGPMAMMMPPPPPPPLPPHVCEAGPSAECVAARQAELDALGDDASKADHDAAEAALAAAQMAYNDKMAAEARRMLVANAACTAGTAACLASHDALIAALEADLAALQADGDATNAQVQAAQTALDEARTARGTVAMALAEIDRSTATGMAVGEATDAANALEDDRSADAIAAAKVAIEEAKEAVGESDAYDERIAMAETAVARAEERNMVDDAVDAAMEAAQRLTEDSGVAAVTAAQGLLDAATKAIEEAEHLSDAEKAAATTTVAAAQTSVTVAKNRNDSDAEEQRMAEEMKEAEEEKQRNEANAATAAKLYAGISGERTASDSNQASTATVRGTRFAGYVTTAGSPTGASVGDIEVGIEDSATNAVLSEDKKKTVAANHGWEGKRYIDPAGGDSYEAIVYSNVEAPTPGRKFGHADDPGSGATREYEYHLDALDDTAHTVDTTDEANQAKVALTGVTRTAGTETFKPSASEKASGADRYRVPGSYHGVSGTYYCTHGAATCAARVSAKGFELGTIPTDGVFTASASAWVFVPSSASAQVRDAKDTAYASYGWWLRKTENGKTFTASAFVAQMGVTNSGGLNDLNGTATYMGGAAGKYALSSALPGGTNDAGHFTARATLEADFTNNTATTAITGTIDQFMGADGMTRDWSVKLNGGSIGDTGGTGNGGGDGTEWTIGGTAAADSGDWRGQFLDTGTDGVPKAVTGTFYSEYGTAGRMVGAFGANKQ